MKDLFISRTLLILTIFGSVISIPLLSRADVAPLISVTQGEVVTLTLKLINTGEVALKGVTVHCEDETMPDWFVAEAVETAVDVPIHHQPDVFIPFRFTIDK